MWTYVARRLFLMVPMLFGISIVNFAIVNLAPAPRSSNVQPSGDFDTSKSMEADEAVHIFRRTFFLDRPTFLNTRFDLTDDEIFWLLVSPENEWMPPARKLRAQYDLDDYGRVIVPHLLSIAKEPDARRDGFERRWKRAREDWIAAGRPPGEVAWPPPETPPPFDEAFRNRVVALALARLANNAPRRPEVVYGEEATEEALLYNREVRKEQRRLRQIFLDPRTSDTEKLEQWRAWFADHAGEWDYSFGDKARMLFFETRFAKFWDNLLSLDLGTSFIHRQKVWKLIGDRIHVSLTLSLGSLLLAYLISIPLGILSAVKHRSLSDVVLSIALFGCYSLPTMFIGVLLVQYLGIDAKLLPIAGFSGVDYEGLTVLGKIRDVAGHLAMPIATLTIPSLAYLSRYMKSGMIETIRADFIRTARAKGLSEFVVVAKHAVRNGLIPIITLLGASLPVVIGGSIVVEFIFQIDGMGKLAYVAVIQRDYAVIMGLNILTAVLTMVGVFLADLAYAVVDPRISYK